MTDCIRDLRQGFRLLFRAPGFAATAGVTLVVGATAQIDGEACEG